MNKLTSRKTGWVAEYFNMNPETVRKWASEFKDYLSTNANPESGATRYFDSNDLEVFALAHTLLVQQNGTYDEVREQLKDGVRGSAELVAAIVTGVSEEKQIALLQTKLQEVTIQLQDAIAVNDRAVQEAAVQRQRAESAHEERERVQGKLDEANQTISDLNGKIGKLELLLELAKMGNVITLKDLEE
ncbi:MAG: hypothetical protein AAF846_26935 [Chloroflexota bacterium]